MPMKKKIAGSGELDLLIKEERWGEVIRAETRQVKWLYENSNKTTMVVDEKLVQLIVQSLQKILYQLKIPVQLTTINWEMINYANVDIPISNTLIVLKI